MSYVLGFLRLHLVANVSTAPQSLPYLRFNFSSLRKHSPPTCRNPN